MFSNILSDYEIISKVKKVKGAFGDIYLGRYTNSTKSIAVRKCSVESCKDTDLQILWKDICFTRQLKHRNINVVLHSFVWKLDIYIIYPLMCFGSCRNLLENVFHTGFPEGLIAVTFKDVFEALDYLHKKDFVHGSVCASHILLNGQKAVLSCFRESRSLENREKKDSILYGMPSSNQKSLNWLAPEVLEQNLYGYTNKSDIYSVGITLCEIANGVQPYLDTQPTFMYTEKIRGNVPSLLDQSTFSSLPEEQGLISYYTSTINRAYEIYSQRIFSDAFHQLAEICLDRSPKKRWSAQKLKTHSFFKQCRNTSISDYLQIKGCDFPNSLKVEDKLFKTEDEFEFCEDVQWDFE